MHLSCLLDLKDKQNEFWRGTLNITFLCPQENTTEMYMEQVQIYSGSLWVTWLHSAQQLVWITQLIISWLWCVWVFQLSLECSEMLL